MKRLARHVEPYVGDRLLSQFPGVLVTGARAIGKTTSMQAITKTHLDLSIPAVSDAVASDPDATLSGLDEPVLIDEWQEVPEVLAAVKRSIDRDSMPGRYVLTGSVRGPIGSPTAAATGRLVRVRMYGLSQAEREGRTTNSVDLAFASPERLAGVRIADLDRNDYLTRMIAGGFPSIGGMRPDAQMTWLRSYVHELIERDAVVVGGLREPRKLRAVLGVAAARSAQELKPESMYREAGVAKTTLYSHLDLLDDLQILIQLPAWTPSRLRRLIHAPKLHLTDSGLAAAVLGVDARAVRLDGGLAGALLESFVAGELLRHTATAVTPVDLHHLRTQDGHEVDVVAVATDGRVVGFEVKAAATVTAGDARGLRWLRDRLADRFVAGFVLHTGPLPRRLDDRIWAVPLAALWRAEAS